MKNEIILITIETDFLDEVSVEYSILLPNMSEDNSFYVNFSEVQYVSIFYFILENNHSKLY